MYLLHIHMHMYMLHIHTRVHAPYTYTCACSIYTCIHAPYMCLGRRQLTQEKRPQGKAVEESSYQRGDVGEEEGAAREMAAVIQSSAAGMASEIVGRAGELAQWLKPLPHSLRTSVQIPRTHPNTGWEWRSICNLSLERQQGLPRAERSWPVRLAGAKSVRSVFE